MSNEYKDWTADNMQELKYNESLLRFAKMLAIYAYSLANKKNSDKMFDAISETYIVSLEQDIEAANKTNLLNGADINIYHLYMVIYLQDFITHMRASGYIDDCFIDEFLKPFPTDVIEALWKLAGEFKGSNVPLYYAFRIVNIIQTLKSNISYVDIEKIDNISIGIDVIKECHKCLFQKEQ